MDDKHVYMLSSSGPFGFNVSPSWTASFKRSGLICSHCDGVMADAIFKFNEILVIKDPELITKKGMARIHYSYISRLLGGAVVSLALFRAIGPRLVRRHHLVIPIRCAEFAYPHVYIIERNRSGCLRGYDRSDVSLCRKCERLLYWPGAKHGYLLNRYWRKNSKFRVLDKVAYVDPKLFENRIEPLSLNRLTVKNIKIAKEPADDLRPDFDGMIQSIQRRT